MARRGAPSDGPGPPWAAQSSLHTVLVHKEHDQVAPSAEVSTQAKAFKRSHGREGVTMGPGDGCALEIPPASSLPSNRGACNHLETSDGSSLRGHQ